MPSPSFSGPAAKSLEEFSKCLDSMPAQYVTAFNNISSESIATICDKSYLHIWETNSDIDSLLQLTQVIVKLRNIITYVPQATGSAKNVPAGMIIIVEENSGRDNFARVCQLVKHLIGKDGHPHLNGGLMSFTGIKVLRGFNSAHRPDANGRYATKEIDTAARKVVERINKAIIHVFESGAYPTAESKKLVWHNGPVVHGLNYFIDNTTDHIRGVLKAVTITSTLAFPKDGIKISIVGRGNRLEDLQRLEEYLKRLGIFAMFTDSQSQKIEYVHLNTYMYFYAFYIRTFLPGDLTTPHYHAALDALTTYCFRLLNAAKEKRNGAYAGDIVKLVQSKLTPSKAKSWANSCISASSYASKTACQATANDHKIHAAVQLADAPFKLFTEGVPAFARLTFGPAADMIAEHYICAPVAIQFKDADAVSVAASSPSPWRLWLLKPGQSEETVTQRVRGVMLGVLELVRKGKQMEGLQQQEPVVDREEREQWDEVVKACCWALGECKGKLPRGVEEKVKFVENMLRGGTWAYGLGVAAQQGVGQGGQDMGMGKGIGQGSGFGQSKTAGGMGGGDQNGWTDGSGGWK